MIDKRRRANSTRALNEESADLRWQNEHTAWIEDISRWQAEHQQLMSELERLRNWAVKRGATLRAHAHAILTHKQALENADAAATSPTATDRQQDSSINLRVELAAQHAKTRGIHRRFDAHHEAVMDRLQALARETDQLVLVSRLPA